MIETGKRAPTFDLASDNGERIGTSDFHGKRVVVYFYPKDDTSGCTLEARDFSALAADFAALGTVVVGVSPDSVASHAKFRAKYDLAVRLGADPDKSMFQTWGVWVEKSMYGRKYMGVERTTVLISPDGKIARIWKKVKVPGHAAEVLAAARADAERGASLGESKPAAKAGRAAKSEPMRAARSKKT